MVRRLALLLILCSSAAAQAHPQVPGGPQKQPVPLTNASIHPVSGPVIDKGTLVFEGGKIKALGRDISIPSGAETVDLKGSHVYPGLFESFNDIGLVEINS